MVISPASAAVIETLLLFLQFNFAQAFSHFLLLQTSIRPSIAMHWLVRHVFPHLTPMHRTLILRVNVCVKCSPIYVTRLLYQMDEGLGHTEY